MANKKIVVLAALNGGQNIVREGAHYPCTPAEIAEAAYECYQAGAAAIHFHARGEDRKPTNDIKVFGEVIARIREKCPALIQTTNGMGMIRDPVTGMYRQPTDEQRLALLKVEPKQDLFSLACGSWDMYRPWSKREDERTFVNSTDLLRKNIPPVLARGAAIEFEIAEASFLYKLRRLAEEGVFDPNSRQFWLSYGFGFGAAPPIARALLYNIDEGQRVFPQARWEIIGSDHDQFWMSTLALALGCDIVRVGFEDNIYLPNGQVGKSNREIVEAAIRIAKEFGREPATVEEAKPVFGIR
jgi:3-keto-5-aminohexanoate cleavage enzyme